VSGSEALPEVVSGIVKEFSGRISFALKDLQSRRTLLLHPKRRCPTASVIKLPVLIHVMLLAHEGALSLDEPVKLRDGDKKPGSGILQDMTDGLILSLRDACLLMIALSDNTATNLVLDRVGIEQVNLRMAALGCRSTRLFRKVFSDGPPVCRENARYGLGVTTARDMLRLLCLIHAGRIGDSDTTGELRRFLGAQRYRDGIPRFLPPDWTYEGKGGAVDAVRNDVGIVTTPSGRAFAFAVFCDRIPAPLWTADNPGLLAIAKIARKACECLSGERMA